MVQTATSFQENNFLCGEVACFTQVSITSKFESSHGGISKSNLDMQWDDTVATSRAHLAFDLSIQE